MSVKAFCYERNLKQNQFYYRQKQLRELVVDELPKAVALATQATEIAAGWVQLTPETSASSTLSRNDERNAYEESTWITANGWWIEVYEDTSPALLSKILKAVKEVC